jgi:NADH-quinone oxidoreductase subunit H
MISYELSLGLAVIPIFLLVGQLRLTNIVQYQIEHGWMIAPFIGHWSDGWKWLLGVPMFISFAVFTIAIFAETNRLPFDLPEAETELVGGYHTEYSSMKFAMFFMAEYANMITVACLASLLFLGGWRGPVFGPNWLQQLLPLFWFVLRVFVFLFVYIWVRGTLPRFRYDQLMAFGWKFLLPAAIANLVVTALVVVLR